MDSKPYEPGMNCAGETAGQVANYLVADLRVYLNPGGAALCDVLSGNIFSAIRESASAALAQRDAEVERLRGLLSGLVRIVEAMRHSTGLGKNQIERLEAAKTALAEAPRHE